MYIDFKKLIASRARHSAALKAPRNDAPRPGARAKCAHMGPG